jgi:hypothetical protein
MFYNKKSMPAKKRVGRPKKTTRRVIKGGKFSLKSIWEGIKKAHQWIKDKKIISSLAGPIGTALGEPAIGSAISAAAKMAGYGKKRGKGFQSGPKGGAFVSGVRPIAVRPIRRPPVRRRPIKIATVGQGKKKRVGVKRPVFS